MAQCFGVMPVVGVKSKSAAKLRFEWFALRTIYSFVLFSFVTIYGGLTIWLALSNTVEFDSVGMFMKRKSISSVQNSYFALQFRWYSTYQLFMECSVLVFWPKDGQV